MLVYLLTQPDRDEKWGHCPSIEAQSRLVHNGVSSLPSPFTPNVVGKDVRLGGKRIHTHILPSKCHTY